MTKIHRALKRIIISVIGFPLFVVGLILIPLPGPGVLVSLLALFILSLEFDWASDGFEKAKRQLKDIYEKSKERSEKIEKWGDKSDKK